MAKARGRPKKERQERRGNVLRIRLTENERKLLDRAAQAIPLDTSTWARVVLLGQAQELVL